MEVQIRKAFDNSVSIFKAPEAPHESSTDGYSDLVQISPASNIVEAAPPAVEPTSMAAVNDEQVESTTDATEVE